MSKYNKTVLTNAGLELATKANKGQAKFAITKSAASTEKLSDKSIAELQQLTELPSVMQFGEIRDVAELVQDKSIVIGVGLVFNNKDLSTSYNLNTIGLYAKEEGSDKEILYAITTAAEPEKMPDYKDKVLFNFQLTMYVVVGQTDNVSVNVVEDGVVTKDELDRVIKALPLKQDIQKLSDKIDSSISNLYDKVKNESKSLEVLNSPTGNNIYDTTINLDTYSTVGITKFLNCKLQSAGQLPGFDQSTDKLYGWIFNIPKWNGATEYQQIVYICDYGNGTLTYVRSRADKSGKKVDFEKLATDKNLTALETKLLAALADLITITPSGAKQVLSNQTINPNNIVDSGVYRISSCKIDAKSSNYTFPGNFWGWLINLNFDDTSNSNAVYQILIVNGKLYYREMSVKSSDYPIFGTFSFLDDIQKLSDKYDPKFVDLTNKIGDQKQVNDTQDTKLVDLTKRMEAQENKEYIHAAADYDTGLAYSKAHPEVIVATP